MAEGVRLNTSSTPINDDESPPTNDGESPPPSDDEAVFTLLFKECDMEGSGLVEVGSLVEFIRKVQLGQQDSGEEGHDSEEDVHKLQYNLHLLQAMLECNAVEGRVDEATYTHIIRMWVKDVRDRSERSSLEVTALSDSEDGVPPEEGDYSTGSLALTHESFETTGGISSAHTDLDRMDLMNSVQDLKLDNKRLQARNDEIQLQMEQSEEHLRELQTQNVDLQQRLKSLQQSLARLQGVETNNVELEAAVQGGQTRCLELTQNVEKLEHELHSLNTELAAVQLQLTVKTTERNELEEEGRALQTLLIEKEELLSHHEGVCTELETQLHECQEHTDALSHTVIELGEANEALRTENFELQTQLMQQQVGGKGKQPLSSTPFRREVPSLHDELVAQDVLTNRGSLSPLVGVGESRSLESVLESSSMVEGSSDEISRIVQQADSKINHKMDLIARELTDLIASQPSPSGSHHTESSALLLTPDKSFSTFESKLAALLKKKKQLQNENAKLQTEVEELRHRLLALERQREEEERKNDGRGKQGEDCLEVGVQTAAIVPPPVATQHIGIQTEEVTREAKPSLRKLSRVGEFPPPPSPTPTPPPLSRTRDLSFISDDRMKELLKAGPEEVESRVRDLLLAVDTDQYTIPQRKSEMYRCREGALVDMMQELDQLKEATGRIGMSGRGEAGVEGVLEKAGQLRPAVETLLHTSEQYGYIVQEEHYASCIALLKTHIGHLKDKIASLQVAEEELEGRRRWKLQRSVSAASFPDSSKEEEDTGIERDQTDSERRADEETKELAFQQAFDSALRATVSQDLTALKRRQQQFVHHCSSLTQRTKQVEQSHQDHLDQWPKSHKLLWALPGSTYRLLKGVFLLLLIVVLALFLFLLLILFYSTVDSCGPHCPTSPLQVMLSALHPHAQYYRSSNVPI